MADALGARVLRVGEGGEVLEEVSTGGSGVFACMLGGDDRRTLYLCVGSSFAEHERRDTRDARLLSCRVDVPGAGLP
jgi:sugar lactone lactonase YvrE